MLARHIRLAGVRLIETALSSKHAAAKFAFPGLPGAHRGISAVTPQGLREQHATGLMSPPKPPRPLKPLSTAHATVSKVVTTPSN